MCNPDKEQSNTVSNEIPWGPTGKPVYDRTYSRKKADGTNETWGETVRRVAAGNIALVHGEDDREWPIDAMIEYGRLVNFMLDFRIIPAGRHLWATGVKGAQFLFNCHVAGWYDKFSDHFSFTLLRLAEGGGVGANYSSRFLAGFGAPRRALNVHVVCDPAHPDYEAMRAAGVLSTEFDSDWHGAFPVEDSREGWAGAMVDLLNTYMTDDEVKHDNRVYDVSRVRAKGSRLATFGGTASGPQPFAVMLHTIGKVMDGVFYDVDLDYVPGTAAMEIDHAIGECIVSGGVRRSARMSIMRWDDPFIEDFLNCKADGSKHWTTNISVEIDDEFLDCLNDPDCHVARDLHKRVIEAMLTNGEPGYWNSSKSNIGEVNEVVATNPCGEIALPPSGACVLGHVNLDAFAPTRHGGPIDILGLIEAHRLMTRFLIRATYGDMKDAGQKAVMDSERRVGVGHLGVQGFLAKQGIRYSDAPHSSFPGLLDELYEEVRAEARKYAFQLRIPEPVKVTTVAPTGTIAKMPGVTEGIHPVLFRYFERRVRFSLVDQDQWQQVMDLISEGYDFEMDVQDKSGNTGIVVFPTKERLVEEVEDLGYDPDIVEIASEIGVPDMLAFQAMYQKHYADNAVSFTVNVPAEPHQDAFFQANPGTMQAPPAPSMERVLAVAEDVRKVLPKLKGTTLMLDGARVQAPYTKITEEQYEAAVAKSVADGTDEDCATGACPVR